MSIRLGLLTYQEERICMIMTCHVLDHIHN